MCECGTRIFYVQDINGQNVTRFINIKDGWLSIQRDAEFPPGHPAGIPNGAVHTWQGVLKYLARLGKDPQLYFRVWGKEVFSLEPVMRVSEFASVLYQPAGDVRAELSDLVIQVED